MLMRIIKAVIKALAEHFAEQRLEREYREALVENERFDQRQRKAEAARNTTEAVLNEKKADASDIGAVRERLLERAARNDARK